MAAYLLCLVGFFLFSIFFFNIKFSVTLELTEGEIQHF